MYVLHHADKPEIYAGLPANPRISPLVEFWRGAAKYTGMALVGAAVVGAFLHRVVAGSNKVSAADEASAADLAAKAGPAE
jgi:formate dehydrogenase iron-sulfur subunit